MKTVTISVSDLMNIVEDNQALQDVSINQIIHFTDVAITTWDGFSISVNGDKMTVTYQ